MQEPRTRRLRARVPNACDVCKLRKIKCSGATPCHYCARRQQPQACRYTASRRRPRLVGLDVADMFTSSDDVQPSLPPAAGPERHSTSTPSSRAVPENTPLRQGLDTAVAEEHDETEVPREARLVWDPNGKLIFIGDCAPLSFFQTVRRLVTSLVDPHAFAPETSSYSALETTHSRPSASLATGTKAPPVDLSAVAPAVSAYVEAAAGLVDLFDNARLHTDISAWAAQDAQAGGSTADVESAVNYIVLAIGCQRLDDGTGQAYFDHARDVAFASLSGNLNAANIQALILITLYMLSACQINGAYLFFGMAVRVAYSIGVHRTAVNARFGPQAHRQRDRLWKSLRVVDLFLSTSMGRPPATSDIDCTVGYRDVGTDGTESFDLLNASVQIFLITETIVVEIYSRRKISPRLTEGISRELREWSVRWLQRLKDAVAGSSESQPLGTANGACLVLSSYYYAVILVSRPFLMVELNRRLVERPLHEPNGRRDPSSGKAKLADACIDAAILMVELVQGAIEKGAMVQRAPVIVSWVFASSLVLGLGLLGGFGRIIERHCNASIVALEYFGQVDGHAMQYSLIAKSLLTTALGYLEKQELEERCRRTESSAQLFGLVPRPSQGAPDAGRRALDGSCEASRSERVAAKVNNRKADKDDPGEGQSPHFSFDFDANVFDFGESLSLTPDFPNLDGFDGDLTLGAMNIFPLLENTQGHIDLANYF
ncbi:filamentous growth regulator 27 [Echria macrotheca]|uniref:Filamentous growth regulator 27 n=1 Tax=Echria macrotheca TaxID=438768 RepID=A0AAJ0F9Q9_9PEZI|nr:filamentous growth regulator 27 [Echria macrotheca]